ncbi:MAG: pentapeptide repeat-containing protein [Chloroflexi bacterium]|nr:pentapeptide repeat-containing protein [Chloroflexota bacterium]
MDTGELLGMLKRDVNAFNRFRRENPTAAIDLGGVDLSGANLAHADLNRANLAGANLRRANLQGANLGSAVLEKADLREADLTSANLHRVGLQGADLQGTRIGGFDGDGRLCMNASSFRGVKWDREQIEEMLQILNQNDRWLIKYQIVPKG